MLPKRLKDRSLYLQIVSKLDKKLRITKGYWHRITSIKHPSIRGKEQQVREALQDPDSIRQSKTDENVFLYYKQYKSYYLCVVARHKNGNGFIITVYTTNKIKEGRLIWQKKQR
ncbi:MAG: DUF4258 domain-containing protein [Candidatus Colwellbacteria bacterium]|nr:DUF4258 domain-containing protein [Candidatus Colwellbacteria bacterium]